MYRITILLKTFDRSYVFAIRKFSAVLKPVHMSDTQEKRP